MGELVTDEEDRPFVACFAAPVCNPDPDSIRVESWVLAEDLVREVLSCIQPTLDSDEERKYVIEYVQKLIRCKLGLEVCPYGSVPLKTYLPDGDIDLTVLSSPDLVDLLPSEVFRVLQEEEQNGNTEFELKDTQFIDAEVKLVKCIVQDIVIDISFNQLGGLCTLCFLEQVDRLAGKDHLFKRGIILIKAWCYYESRILGAHHGLISTYALETLVVYIFHVFHASLNGPLEVLYRFLDYYAKFDWDNYCISLDGPVCKSFLPGLAVETLDNQGTDVLLGAEFRKNCMDMFIVPSKGAEPDIRTFNLKNLNIIDPLKENNNLGRSVHKGNYFRIMSAFRYGARTLGKILQHPNNNIEDEINMFFRNTLQRHKPNYGPDPTLLFSANGFGTLSISPRSESYYEEDMFSRFLNSDLDEFMNDQNAPALTESVDERTAIELWMERGGSELVDGGTVCLRVNNANEDSSSDNSSSDVNDNDSIGETETLHRLANLTGDYDCHIRNLLYGQGCHGYALSTTMVWASTSPPTSPYEIKSPWDPPAADHSWQTGALMGQPNGCDGNTDNVALRGTRPFIPVMSCDTCEDKQPPTSGRRRGRGPPVSNGPHFHRAQVGEANHANRTRKLEFGSFRSVTNDPSNWQSLEVDAYGGKQERIRESSLHLKNEDEFPPLSA